MIQRDIFPLQRATGSSRPQSALPTIDQRAAQKTTDTFTAGSDFTIPAGAAGASVQVNLPNAPILGDYGRTGAFGNTSFAFGGAAATTFDTEVAFIADASNLGGDTTTLANGEYMVDYEAGIVYGKKADTGTTGTATYTFLSQVTDGGSSGDVTAASNLTADAVVVGDDGLKGIKTLASLGNAGEVLTSNGAGTPPSFQPVAGGANTALSNLASVALNTALLPDAAAADDFGSATLPFKDLFLAGSSGTPATNNFRLTGASTSGTRAITLPDATDTLVGKATTDVLTNKTLTSPVINTSVSGTAVLDDDTFGSASSTTVATSESIKAYVDAQIAGVNSPFDATVGSAGADYTTISGALAASKTRLLVIADTTETGACAVPASGLYIYIQKAVNLDMGANQFTFAGNHNLTIEGQENDSSKITFAFTAATNTELVDTGANTSSVTTLRNLTIDNNSTQSGCKVVLETSIAIYENIWYEPPNVANCGIYLSNARSKATNVWVTAPGTTATDVVRVDAGIVRNVTAVGAFTNANDAITVGSEGILDGVYNTGNIKIAVSGGKLLNVIQGGGTFNVDIDGDNSYFSNVMITTGTLTPGTTNDNRFVNCEFGGVTFGAGNRLQFTNCEIGGATTVTALTSMFSDCLFTGAMTISSGDYNQFANCRLTSTLTVNSGAVRNMFSGCNLVGGATVSDQTIFTGCKAGADAGGGAATITISAGTGTIVTGCITDAAISDSGTTSQLSNNFTY